jgi:hypothetical protein
VRRYERTFFANLPLGPILLPQLDEAIALMEALAPCPVETASAALRARGLTTVASPVALVFRAADLFHRKMKVMLDESGDGLRRRL